MTSNDEHHRTLMNGIVTVTCRLSMHVAPLTSVPGFVRSATVTVSPVVGRPAAADATRYDADHLRIGELPGGSLAGPFFGGRGQNLPHLDVPAHFQHAEHKDHEHRQDEREFDARRCPPIRAAKSGSLSQCAKSLHGLAPD